MTKSLLFLFTIFFSMNSIAGSGKGFGFLEIGLGHNQVDAKFDTDVKASGLAYYGGLGYGDYWRVRLSAMGFGTGSGEYKTNINYYDTQLSLYSLDIGYVWGYLEMDLGITKSSFDYSHIDESVGQTLGDYTKYETEGLGAHARLYFTPVYIPGGLLGIALDYFLISNEGYDKTTLTSSTLTKSQDNSSNTMTVLSGMAVYIHKFK